MAGETFTSTHALAGTLFEGRFAPLHDAHGRAAGAIAVATDVSERARSERERALLSSVVRQSRDSVLVTDPGGVIVYVNAAFTTLTGYAPEEIVGRHTVVLADAFGSAGAPPLVEALRHGREWSGGIEIAHVDGSRRQVEFLAMPVRDGGESIEYHVALGRDVTDERELRSRLEQAQKMEAVGQLAGGLAHDFNNLLTAVSGYAQLVHTSLREEDPSRDDVAEIMKASDRAAGLTRQLLAFSRKQVLQPRVLDLAAVIRDVERLLARLLGEDIALVTVLGPDVGHVRADPGHLEQVLVNLAVNARDAMAASGTLTIEATNAVLDDSFVASHPGSFAGPAVRLSVTDTGSGMDEATRARVFEPFFTTKEQGRGTGLGLSTVYGIVKQSGGYVMVESQPGRGSTFTVFLPTASGPVEHANPLAATSHRPVQATGTVLVVEDDPAVRALIVTTLSRQGFRVMEAPDPETALRRVTVENPVDLLISDVVMPGMQGPALSAMLTQMLPTMRTLFVSGYPREALGPGNVVDPSVAFLGKPFTPDELSRRVRQLLS
jgi:PAS domain S-box-containing protein